MVIMLSVCRLGCGRSELRERRRFVYYCRSGSLLLLYLTEAPKLSMWLDTEIGRYVRLVAER